MVTFAIYTSDLYLFDLSALTTCLFVSRHRTWHVYHQRLWMAGLCFEHFRQKSSCSMVCVHGDSSPILFLRYERKIAVPTEGECSGLCGRWGLWSLWQAGADDVIYLRLNQDDFWVAGQRKGMGVVLQLPLEAQLCNSPLMWVPEKNLKENWQSACSEGHKMGSSLLSVPSTPIWNFADDDFIIGKLKRTHQWHIQIWEQEINA